MCPLNTLKSYAMLSNWKIFEYAKSTLILLISTLGTAGEFVWKKNYIEIYIP